MEELIEKAKLKEKKYIKKINELTIHINTLQEDINKTNIVQKQMTSSTQATELVSKTSSVTELKSQTNIDHIYYFNKNSLEVYLYDIKQNKCFMQILQNKIPHECITIGVSK